MTIALALFLLAHGVAHLVGFAGAFALLPPEKVPHSTALFAGHVDVGEIGMRVVGVGWLLLAVGFAIAAGATLWRTHWSPTYTIVVASGSLALCASQLPEARIGLVIDVLLIGFIVVARLL